jgi:putative membrane protein
MNLRKNFHWLQLALTVRGSVIPAVFAQVMFCGGFGLLVSVLFDWQVPVSFKSLGAVIPSIVLGLLLVFRTNTAYERFWEGRKAWGQLVNNIRNLARQILVAIPTDESSDHCQKISVLNLLPAFAIALKLHLRSESIDRELTDLLSPAQIEHLQKIEHIPLAITFWISQYLEEKYRQGKLDRHQLVNAIELLNNIADTIGICERILKTPIPLAYAVHLKQLVLIYCLLLPFQLVADLQWWTGPVVALISFTLFGIEEIGMEIENPFGRDYNDLPLDRICKTIKINVNELIDINQYSALRCHETQINS